MSFFPGPALTQEKENLSDRDLVETVRRHVGEEAAIEMEASLRNAEAHVLVMFLKRLLEYQEKPRFNPQEFYEQIGRLGSSGTFRSDHDIKFRLDELWSSGIVTVVQPEAELLRLVAFVRAASQFSPPPGCTAGGIRARFEFDLDGDDRQTPVDLFLLQMEYYHLASVSIWNLLVEDSSGDPSQKKTPDEFFSREERGVFPDSPHALLEPEIERTIQWAVSSSKVPKETSSLLERPDSKKLEEALRYSFDRWRDFQRALSPAVKLVALTTEHFEDNPALQESQTWRILLPKPFPSFDVSSSPLIALQDYVDRFVEINSGSRLHGVPVNFSDLTSETFKDLGTIPREGVWDLSAGWVQLSTQLVSDETENLEQSDSAAVDFTDRGSRLKGLMKPGQSSRQYSLFAELPRAVSARDLEKIETSVEVGRWLKAGRINFNPFGLVPGNGPYHCDDAKQRGAKITREGYFRTVVNLVAQIQEYFSSNGTGLEWMGWMGHPVETVATIDALGVSATGQLYDPDRVRSPRGPSPFDLTETILGEMGLADQRNSLLDEILDSFNFGVGSLPAFSESNRDRAAELLKKHQFTVKYKSTNPEHLLTDEEEAELAQMSSAMTLDADLLEKYRLLEAVKYVEVRIYADTESRVALQQTDPSGLNPYLYLKRHDLNSDGVVDLKDFYFLQSVSSGLEITLKR